MLLVEVPSLLLLCLSAAAGQQGTTVTPGEDATLQCHCPSDAAITMLEWTRLEQKSDGYVFFFRNKRLYEDYQHLSFRGRVELSDPEMKDGDVSVTLKNVTINDTGTYTCRVTSRKTENGETTEFSDLVSLTVTDSGHSAPPKFAEGNKDEGDKDEGDKDEGDNGGGNKDEGDKDEGDKDEGDNGGGNKDGRKSHELGQLARGTVCILPLIGFVVFISYKLMKKHTHVSTTIL